MESSTPETSNSNSETEISRASTPPTSPDAESTPKKRKWEGDAEKKDRKRAKEDTKLKGRKETTKEVDKAAEMAAQAVWKRIDRDVKSKIRKRERAGEYGAVASQEREKAIRVAKKGLKKHLVVDAMLNGELPNPKNYTREKALANYDKDMKMGEKAEKQAKRRTKELKKEAREAKRVERTQAKAQRRAEKKARIPGVDQKPESAPSADQIAVAAKLLKLTAQERIEYEERAKTKNQTLEQYLLRRIQKKGLKK